MCRVVKDIEEKPKEKQQELPIMKPGRFRLKYPLSLREGAGLNYPKKQIKYENTPPGMLPQGSVIEILEIKNLSISIWGCLPTGWLCLYMSHTSYVEEL